MKKWNLLLAALMLLLLPASGAAQELPDFLFSLCEGVGEGLEQGAMQALAAMDRELTLEMIPSSERIEEEKTMTLIVRAGNPRPQEAKVAITLDLPQRLSAAPDAAWEAVLPAAELDPQTGELVPAVVEFAREIALAPDGVSEDVVISAEMNMGTRYYKAQTPIALCVADVKAKAQTVGIANGRAEPGDAFSYRVELTNSGTAGKAVAAELKMPEGVTLEGELPEGFEIKDRAISGSVRVEAAGRAELSFPVCIDRNMLDGDADAMRLLSGALRVDGERVALPRVEVCGAKISARLLMEKENLAAGDAATLSVVVVNSGLAAADVKLSCVLPQGLELDRGEKKSEEATPGEAVSVPPENGDALPMMIAEEVSAQMQGRTLAFDLHMDAARETAQGVTANTQVLHIPVIAKEPREDLSETLMGAALAWSVDGSPAELSEAAVLRVYQKAFLGMSKEDWNGVFWAGVMMLAAVACLYAAAHREEKTEDFCCD